MLVQLRIYLMHVSFMTTNLLRAVALYMLYLGCSSMFSSFSSTKLLLDEILNMLQFLANL